MNDPAHPQPPHEPAPDPASGDAPPHRLLDAGDLAVAFEARNDFEAQCVRTLLQEVGIQSVTIPSGAAIFGFPLRPGGGIPVRVLPEDLTRARQTIAEAKFVGKSIDWDDVDVGEVPPDVARVLAGARRTRMTRRAISAVAIVALVVIAVAVVRALVVSIAGMNR